jgi:type II secretory pathway predicted ATPase ExeA
MFGLRTDPFPPEPSAGAILPNLAHVAVLDAFDRWKATPAAAPLALITGGSGSGKTCLLHAIHRVVANDNTTACGIVVASETKRTDVQLLRQIIQAFDAEPAGRTGLRLQAEARAIFDTITTTGRQPLLLIDDADLSGSQLEIIRSLLTGTSLRLILIGAPDLADRVQRRQSLLGLTGLNERLLPLDPEGVRTFIHQRLDAVRIGTTGYQLIDDDAITTISDLTGGTPGTIVRLMHAALQSVTMPELPIGAALIQHVAATLELPGNAPVTAARRARSRRDPVIQTRMPLDLFQGEEGTP